MAIGTGVIKPFRMLAREHQRHLLAGRTSARPRARCGRRRCRATAPAHGSRSSATTGTARAASGNISPCRRRCRLPPRISRRTASSMVFARLDEAGEARPGIRREASGAAEQAALAVDRQHDRDRVGAREMLHLAGRAVAPPAGLDRARLRAAVGAEAVPSMPDQQRLAFGQRRQVLARDQAAHRDGAQVGESKASSASSALRSRPARCAIANRGAPSISPRKALSDDAPERMRFAPR